MEWVFQAWYYGSGGRCSQEIFNSAIERGIRDLDRQINVTTATVDDLWGDIRIRGPIIGRWIVEIQYHLCPERIKNDADRARLIDMMVDVRIVLCRKLSEKRYFDPSHWFSSLAAGRHPGDRSAQKMFVDDCVRRALAIPDKVSAGKT